MNITYGIIIGAMKSGTTSLYYYLTEHPEVASAKDKEPHFFSMDHVYSKGMQWYNSLWTIQPEHRVALEASTTYAMNPKYPHTLDRIFNAYDNNFKFIYIVRNPIKRIESHMRHMLSEGLVKSCELINDYIDYSEYARQIDLYVERFGRDNIYILSLEEFQNNPYQKLSEICDYLQINSNYSFERVGMIMNSQQTLNLQPWVRDLYKVPFIKSVFKLITPEIRHFFYSPLSRKKPIEVTISDEQKKVILEKLTPDLRRLRDVYGINAYDKWGIDI